MDIIETSVVSYIKCPFRDHQFALSKAQFEGNSGSIYKNCNAAERELVVSLRASLQGAIRFVAISRRSTTMPSKPRLTAGPLEAR